MNHGKHNPAGILSAVFISQQHFDKHPDLQVLYGYLLWLHFTI